MPTRTKSPGISTFVIILTGLTIAVTMLWWQPIQPAGLLALLASSVFIVLAHALHPWRS